MSQQQSKRRRKRYQAGSAYAGDVKPTGILGILGSTRTMQIVFLIMAAALVAGVVVGILTRGRNGQDTQKNVQGFVDQTKNDTGITPGAPTPEVKSYAAAPQMVIDPSKSYTATIKTADGDIQVELLPQQAPQTVNNFVFLARDGFYNGLIFHYVQKGFEAIAGDPYCTTDSTTGSCKGRGGPGYDLNENVDGTYDAGTLGMANGSQFFIALEQSDQFKGFTPFGTITSGLAVAESLTAGTPIESVTIQES